MEKCQITEKEDGFHIAIRPEAVSEPLKEKLSIEDITKGTNMVNEITKLHFLNNSLYRQCSDVKCIESCKNPFKSIPNGNPKADIVLLNKMPTEYETYMMCSHVDTTSIFLSLILSRINMTRYDVYCTDMIKCNCNSLDEQSFRSCIENYLMKEIEYIQPKIIICNGLSTLKTWAKLGYIEGLPQDISYDNIYDVTISGLPLKIMAIYDLEKVLQKQGQELTECKGRLWIQILNALNAIKT